MNSPRLTNILLIIIGVLLAIAIFVFYQSWEQSHVTARDYDRTDFRDQQNRQQFNQQNVVPVNPNTVTPTPVNNSQVTLDTTSGDIESVSVAQQYKTALTNALQQPANFNGHYVLTGVGCGSGCIKYIGVDKNTGKAFSGPSEDLGMYGGLPREEPNFSLESDILKTVAYDKINVYKFNGGRNSFMLMESFVYPRQ